MKINLGWSLLAKTNHSNQDEKGVVMKVYGKEKHLRKELTTTELLSKLSHDSQTHLQISILSGLFNFKPVTMSWL